MRLWHQKLIPHLPRQQLLGQHREICALRGAGWGRKHSVVNYVFDHDPAYLVAYHYLIMKEMEDRGYKPDQTWKDLDWRGKTLGSDTTFCNHNLFVSIMTSTAVSEENIYTEHNDAYLQECLSNLASKGIEITI